MYFRSLTTCGEHLAANAAERWADVHDIVDAKGGRAGGRDRQRQELEYLSSDIVAALNNNE